MDYTRRNSVAISAERMNTAEERPGFIQFRWNYLSISVKKLEWIKKFSHKIKVIVETSGKICYDIDMNIDDVFLCSFRG